ncbi:MAG: hypothetical protein LBC07_00070 [Elusimicrobiota bacterium]|jgi:hypothetical protein|nr:hypothetical protein [Elusimicrobiota bacterium]
MSKSKKNKEEAGVQADNESGVLNTPLQPEAHLQARQNTRKFMKFKNIKEQANNGNR